MRKFLFVGAIVLASLFLNGALPAQAQEQQSDSSTAKAIEAYQQGNTAEAIKQLQLIVRKRPDDAEAWHYLALAFNKLGCIGSSRPALEQVVRLRPDSADAHAKLAFALIITGESQKALGTAQRALELGDQSPETHYAIAEASLRAGDPTKALEAAETVLKIDPNFTAALITKSFAQYHLKRLSEAAASLEQILARTPDDIDAESWREQLESLRARIYRESNPGPQILTGKEVTQKARVLSKPEPQYSEEARKAGVSGTVVLRAVFTAEGEVKDILITRALGYGLITKAIRAARQIRFTPAMKDGAPVSMHIQLQYNFNLY